MMFQGQTYEFTPDTSCTVCRPDLGWHGALRGAYFMAFGDAPNGIGGTVSVGWDGPYVPGQIPKNNLISIETATDEWVGNRRLTAFDIILGDPVPAPADGRSGAKWVQAQVMFAGSMCVADDTHRGGPDADPATCHPVVGQYDGPVQVWAENLAAAGL